MSAQAFQQLMSLMPSVTGLQELQRREELDDQEGAGLAELITKAFQTDSKSRL